MAASFYNFSNEEEKMDDEKTGIYEEKKDQYSLEGSCLAGPFNLFTCIHYIRLCHERATMNECSTLVRLDDILTIFSTNSTDFNKEIDQLHKLAQENCLNLYMCIIDYTGKNFYFLNQPQEQSGQNLLRSYIVFDQLNRNFYAYYQIDDKNKRHTTFSLDDTYTLKVFEKLVDTTNWSNHNQMVQRSTDQSNDILTGLDRMNDQDVSKVKRFKKNPDTIESNEHLPVHRSTHKSMEIIETNTTVQTTSLNDREQRMVSDKPILTEPPIPTSYPQSTISTSIAPLPNTTNDYSGTIKLSNLVLLNQPTRLRHCRTFKELFDKTCPAVPVEGAKQNTPLQFELPSEINRYKQVVFYLGVYPTTYDKKEHEERLLVPLNTTVKKDANLKTNDLNNLVFKDGNDEFDHKTKGVFSKITVDELQQLRKEWTFKMINLYRDHRITKELIKEKKLKWCRLMFAIYIKLSNSHFERVSPPSYSDLIEGTNGSQSMHIPNESLSKFCERGGQIMYIPLDELAKKDDLCVSCNGKELTKYEYQIAENILSFETPVCPKGQTHLDVVIKDQGKNWSITCQQPYRAHDDHMNPCGMIGED